MGVFSIVTRAVTADRVSAASSFATVMLGGYVVFFSPASEALVTYLQSEITARNNRISNLELIEGKLNSSIDSQRRELENLNNIAVKRSEEITELHDQEKNLRLKIGSLNDERKSLQDNIANLIQISAWNEVKSSLLAKLVSTIFVTWPINLIRESKWKNKPRVEQIWKQNIDFLQREIKKLKASDNDIAMKIFDKFKEKCGHLSRVRFSVPAFNWPEYDMSEYMKMTESDQERYSQSIKAQTDQILDRINKISDRVSDARNEIENCFKSL